MKLIILHLDAANKHHSFPRVSRRFESIVNHAREITWQHDTHGPRRHHGGGGTIVHDDYQRVEPCPPYPSARLPRVCLSGHTVGGPCTILWGIVGYCPTQRPSKQVNLWDPKKSYMRQYITQSLFIRTQLTWALIDTSGGYHLGAPNIRSDHSPSFPSSILHFSLIAPPGLQLCQHFHKST
jgi:hypothetical protein